MVSSHGALLGGDTGRMGMPAQAAPGYGLAGRPGGAEDGGLQGLQAKSGSVQGPTESPSAPQHEERRSRSWGGSCPGQWAWTVDPDTVTMEMKPLS